MAEAPNSSIHRFNAYYMLDDEETKYSLSEKSLLLRGSTLRATEWCVCAVVYSGAHTKLSLNSKRPPSKLSSVDRIVNRTLLVAIGTMICVCIISMIFGVVWQDKDNNAAYLCLHQNDNADLYPDGGGCESSAPSSVLNIFTFATLYNNFVCISMYVSLEMVYLAQSFFVSNDLGLYDEETDTPAECHTSGMCADLGQVRYVLSDKTGTLTKNQMVVQQFSFSKHVFGEPLLSLSPPVPPEPMASLATTASLRNMRKEQHSMSLAAATAGNPSTSRISLSLNDVDLSLETDASLLTNHSELHPRLDLIQSVLCAANELDRERDHEEDHRSARLLSAEEKQRERDDERHRIGLFLRVLVYCNTAMLMPDEKGCQSVSSLSELQDRLQAESPDEVALVLSAAEQCGVLLEQRTSREIVCRGLSKYIGPMTGAGVSKNNNSNDANGDVERVELLAVNEFDSDRKMMSVVIRLPNGKRYLLCKGADSSVLTRCVSRTDRQRERESLCRAHIDYFANTGLRTLAMSYREIDTDEFTQWMGEYLAACNSLTQRKEALHQAALRIESDMTLLGAIGIEDELQDGVAESLSMLIAAGMNVWMITGDKAETAVAIAKKCALIQPHKHDIERVLNLTENALRERIEELHKYVMKIQKENPAGLSKLALIVDGISLESLFVSESSKQLFTELMQCLPTVIACRVSPLQKAALVRLVKSAKSAPVTLGIGDGANDVGMIHESRVGVGISGKEGRHAANAADFAIAQFRFIVPLLLEHGRFNYIRCSKLVLYSFFKNLMLVSVLFYFCTYSGFSGTIPLDSIIFSGYNFYLGLPILVLGATDFDVPRRDVYRFPLDAYRTGRDGEMLNLKNMAKWCIFAFVQGLLLFTVAIRFISGPTAVYTSGGYFSFNMYGTGLNTASGGSGLGIFAEGFILYTCCVFAMQYKVISIFVSPNWIFWLLWFLSFAGYFLFTYVYGLFTTLDWYNTVPNAMDTPNFWLAIVIVPLMLVLSDHVFEKMTSFLDPTSRDILVQKLKDSVAVKTPVEGERESGGSNGFVLRPISQSTNDSTSATSPMAPKGLQDSTTV